MNDKINGIIIDGKVYEENHNEYRCNLCGLADECDNNRLDIQLCCVFGANTANDFNYKFSQALTDKLNEK